MKRLATTVAVAIALSGCSTSTATTTTTSASTLPALTVAPAAPTTPGHVATTVGWTPLLVTVKYRSDPVDVARPGFASLDGGSSSLVDAAFYDAANEYMVISLSGTAYHYCGMPSSTWSSFTGASSLGSIYEEQIKGRFDCRIGVVPDY